MLNFFNIMVFLLFIIAIIRGEVYNDHEHSMYPLINANFDSLIQKAYYDGLYLPSADKYIPRNLFIAFREIPPPASMYAHAKKMIDDCRQHNWSIHLMDPGKDDAFIDQYFAGTSIQWVYHLINDRCKVAAIDIWRYAALYAFGGFYIDDDASIGTPLEKVIRNDDAIILAKEGIAFEECYHSDYHLSAQYQMKRHQFTNISSYLSLYDGKSIVQYAMFFAPRSPVLYAILINIVDMVRKEYNRQSVVLPHLHQHTKLVCITGPFMFAATLRELYLSEATLTDDKAFRLRMMYINFEEYNGTYRVEGFKAYSKQGRTYEGSYLDLRHKGHVSLLKRYVHNDVNLNPRIH